MKRFITILLISLLLLAACDDKLNDDIVDNTTGNVVLKVVDAEDVRSILPVKTEIKGYSVTLTNMVDSSVSYTNKFKKDETIEFDSVLIGAYEITVDAYSDDALSNTVASGEGKTTVLPTDTNSVTIKLDWIDGSGSFSLTIDWAGLTNEDNFFSEALSKKSLGFLAWDKENNKAFNDAEIEWVTDFDATSFNYSQDNIPTTKNKRSSEISFRIYSLFDGKNQVIAETFNTYVTILANMESIPDGNESFSINDDNLITYLKNVTDVKSSLNDEDSAKNVDISWEYPYLSDGSYLLTSWITNNSDGSKADEKTVSYTVKDGAVSGAKSLTFTNLDPKYTYSVHFVNKTNDENLIYSYSVEEVPLKEIRTKVKVESISFASSFLTTYVMGDEAEVSAVISPTDATYPDYTVSGEDSVTVDGKKVSFPLSGDYKITLRSEDENAVSGTAEKMVTVRLAVPASFAAERTEEGISLTWNGVETATSYVIEKKYNDTTETISSSETTYLDKNIKTGVSYTYRVKAVRDESKFDSDYSGETSAKLPNKVINITVPSDVEREAFASLVESAIKGQYVTDSQGMTIILDTTGDFFNNASWTWILNGTHLNGSNTINIDSSTSGLIINTTESANTLELAVTKGDYTYSASSVFHYIAVEPGEVTISGENTVKGVNNTITLTATTSSPAAIIWSSSDTYVATVSSTGVVTALNDGVATITATIAATGRSATYNITSIVSDLKFVNVPTNFLVVEKDGVSVENGYKTLALKNYLAGAVEGRGKYVWSSSNANVAAVDTNGNVTPNASGTSTITVQKDGVVSTSYTVTVYNFDIYHEKDIATNRDVATVGGQGEKNLSLKEANNLSYSSNITSINWCFEGNESSLKKGSLASTLIISNETSFTEAKIKRGAYANSIAVYAIIKNGTTKVATLTYTDKAS